MQLRTTLIGALVCLAVVPLFGEEEKSPRKRSRKAKRDLTAAVERFEELLEAEKYDEAAKLADRLVDQHPRSPIARLVQRTIDLIELTPVPVEGRELTIRTYPVADLVVPIPRTANIGIGSPVGPHRATGIGVDTGDERPNVDFDTLVELVTSTIAPDSWTEAGGAGSIQTHETTLSLVIRQTDAVHGEIADLLTQLRRLQDVQVTLELRYVEVPNAMFERIGIDFDATAADGPVTVPVMPVVDPTAEFGSRLDEEGHAVLSDVEMHMLMKAVQSETRANVLMAPKVTLFNGQTARIQNTDVDGERGMLLQAVTTADRRHVRLKIARDAEDGIDVLSSVRTFQPLDGNTIVLDRGTRTREVRKELPTPVVANVPYVNKLFKNTSVALEETRILIAVTPRIIVQEEEEELLGIDD